MVRALGVQIARLQSSRLAALRGERVGDPEREIALDDAEHLRERLQRGQERLFAVSLYLLLRAKTIAELDELTHRVEEQLDALLAHSRGATWEQPADWTRRRQVETQTSRACPEWPGYC